MNSNNDGGRGFIDIVLDLLMVCVGIYAVSFLINFIFGDVLWMIYFLLLVFVIKLIHGDIL